jgi:hypothetical protein
MRFVLCFLLLAPSVFGQDSIQQKDSLKLQYHQKSMLYSALIPGWGQIRNTIDAAQHNNAIWKVPLIYGGLGAAGYFLVSNQQTQLELKQEYTNRINGGSLNPTWAAYDDPAILQLYRQYLDWRDLSILGFAAIYLFQIAEAGAEAHFVHFDTNPDLSISIEPSFVPNQYLGAKIQLTFR